MMRLRQTSLMTGSVAQRRAAWLPVSLLSVGAASCPNLPAVSTRLQLHGSAIEGIRVTTFTEKGIKGYLNLDRRSQQ
jgi:hypothetical protein